VFLCVGVVGVFFELFVFFGGVYVVVLLSTVWRGSSVAFIVLFLLGSTTAICVALLVVL
jgi:uncharacterized membrane protein